jgi:hypothetical protein
MKCTPSLVTLNEAALSLKMHVSDDSHISSRNDDASSTSHASRGRNVGRLLLLSSCYLTFHEITTVVRKHHRHINRTLVNELESQRGLLSVRFRVDDSDAENWPLETSS